jgi:hypothetical protein
VDERIAERRAAGERPSVGDWKDGAASTSQHQQGEQDRQKAGGHGARKAHIMQNRKGAAKR